jgi:cytochrome c oxidase subunit III
MIARRTIDASALPEFAFGHRDPLWWGAISLLAIEGTMVALLLATYFYVRGNFTAWPPTGVGVRVQTYAALEAAILAASVLPTHRLNLAALRGDLRGMQRWLVVLLVAGVAYLALRWAVFASIPFRWDLNAYTSTFWAFLVLNAIHGISGVLENAVMLVLLLRGPVEKKHLVDVHTGGYLWYFVVGSWVPVWFVLYVAPRLLRS